MSVFTKLFPAENREAAGVAFIRTAWQVVRGTGFLGGAGIIAISAADLMAVDWALVAATAGAVAASGILSGLLAAGDILVHGLPGAYKSDT